jgi:hypothetical protein
MGLRDWIFGRSGSGGRAVAGGREESACEALIAGGRVNDPLAVWHLFGGAGGLNKEEGCLFASLEREVSIKPDQDE